MDTAAAVKPHAISTAEEKRQHKAAWGAVLAGTALSIYGWTRRSASGAALGVAGGAIALKAASAGPIADLIGTEASISRSVIVMRSAAELYAAWRDAEKARSWLVDVSSVDCIEGSDKYAMTFANPETGSTDCLTEILSEVPSQSITWKLSLSHHRNLDLNGRVEFKELSGNLGTQVRLTLQHKMHTGLLQSGIATVVGRDPERRIAESLRRFKMLMEAGEIATIQGQSHGPRKLKGRLVEKVLGEAA